MRILVTGGSGFVGRLLCQRLTRAGHELWVVSRDPQAARRVLPAEARVVSRVAEADSARPEGLINLAGESIAGKRWSEAQKARLVDSRLTLTRELVALCQRLVERQAAPRVLVSGSAMGYYGDQGDTRVDEQTPPHDEFAHRLCRQWEAVAREAEPLGVRVALLRTGLVLDRDGGSLAKMLPPFKLGLGGRFGDGRQFMPWIHRLDLVRAIEFLLTREDLSGPFNGSAPTPVRNADFTRALARQLRRPAIFPAPAFVLRLALGEMADLLLSGADMRPDRLEAAGFSFEYPTLDRALAAILE
ncbi:TIGR01777 family oxidoreductase [Halomonas salifodinae]|uniref:TIGR01777 family oxidoreductase n=1 Tax=Halomonas salifodinae TaxID=438745 RepID=A0ABW2F118_9GAMM